VLVGLDLSRGNISYFIVVGWLYALVDFISNFSGFPCCADSWLFVAICGCLKLFLVIGTCYTSIVPT
jgi:hypothetical protein